MRGDRTFFYDYDDMHISILTKMEIEHYKTHCTICVKSLSQDNFNTTKVIKTGLQTVVVFRVPENCQIYQIFR